MRQLSAFLGYGVSTLALVAGGAGCDDASGAGGASSSSTSGSMTSGSTSSGTTSTGASSSTGGGNLCDPGPSCDAVDKTCMGLVDNSGKTKFGLRMSSIKFQKPAPIGQGVVGSTFQGDVPLPLPACNVSGPGTFSWLLQLDTAAGTLKMGGAKPVQDPKLGWAFEMGQSGSFTIAPTTLQAKPDAMGKFGSAVGADLVVPLYLDPQGSQVVLFPLRAARVDMATLSASQNCIGSFNAAGLDPQNQCVPDDTHPLFVHGGSLTGHILLEEADAVTITAVSQSLCVLLTGDSATFGQTGPDGVSRCKRDGSNAIVFQGDWCAATNGAASPSCFDAVELHATFSASSALITN